MAQSGHEIASPHNLDVPLPAHRHRTQLRHFRGDLAPAPCHVGDAILLGPLGAQPANALGVRAVKVPHLPGRVFQGQSHCQTPIDRQEQIGNISASESSSNLRLRTCFQPKGWVLNGRCAKEGPSGITVCAVFDIATAGAAKVSPRIARLWVDYAKLKKRG